MNKLNIAAILLLGSFSATYAQSQISGTVKDQQGIAQSQVTVSNLQLNLTTFTDSNGNFTINGTPGNELEFKRGSLSKKVMLENTAPLSVVLEQSEVLIDEIVMIGYGTKKKSDITGAIGSVSREDFNQGLVTNAGQLIQGKVAGVMVSNISGEPGAGQDIVIRGVGSLRSGTTPLYVIDGFVIDNSPNGVSTNPMNFVNPQDIESIDILKDASAAAIYGSRAANGVIIINTKKGRSGRTQMSFSSALTFSQLANKMDVFSADAFRQNIKQIGANLDDGGGSTDWQDELTRSAMSSSINFSMSGGDENSTYFGSLGYDDQEGILYNSSLKRYSARINLSQKAINNRLKVDFNLTGSRTENSRPATTSIVSSMLTMNPTYSPYENGEPTKVFNNGAFNPIIRQQLYDNTTQNNRIIGNIAGTFEILKNLKYKLNVGGDFSNSERVVQNMPHDIPLEEGSLFLAYNNNESFLVENTLTYDFRINRHKADVMVGHSYQDIQFTEKGWNYQSFPNNGIEPQHQINAANNTYTTQYSLGVINELQSWFGRLNYSFDDKYLLTFTMRADGSSKFGDNKKYAYFPSVAAGWNISKENFLLDSRVVSNLKLRGGWGQTGNQEIPSKITKASYRSNTSGNSTYPLDGSSNYPVGIALVRTANPDLQWEVSTQTNVGLDFGLFGNKLTGTVDYFTKVSEEMILEINPTDPITPTEKIWKNIPDMTLNNSGVEISLDYKTRLGQDFGFNVGGNMSFIKNEIRNSSYKILTTGEAQGPGTTNAVINGYMNGHPIGSFYVRDFMGIDENGINIFRDANNDGVINDDDRIIAGSAMPDLTYSFYLKFDYKNFDLTANFNGVSGNMIYNNTASTLFTRGRLSLSNNTTDQAMEYANESANNTNMISTRYLEKGDFLRLSNLTIGYNIIPANIGIGDWARNIRLAITGQNLLTLTKYSGFDPEINSGLTTGGIQTFGIDYSTYPKARSFVLGVNIDF